MTSYYDRVIGTLFPGQIARSEDINNIQSNVQDAFERFIKDLLGDGCILDEDENAMVLMPTPFHVDQENKNYDPDDNFISFYDRYFKQKISIEKSEIRSIRLQVRNTSNLSPTIFAEIRDHDMNLLKEANLVFDPTGDEPTEIEFIFNLQHLPISDYYFILRPVDITTVDLAKNGDESIYDLVTPSMFMVRFDKNGSYGEELQASYNGVDYLNANLLEDQVFINGDIIEAYENNYDLYFEQVFSNGNTYLINPARCIVRGQYVEPLDTHVVIDGPSRVGDRIDLVTLGVDGLLYVTQGMPYTGEKSDENYPINTLGLKIAYITTYQNSNSTWTCPVCHSVNDSHIAHCFICGNNTNEKIPLIEQNDDNEITRQRSILERLRRLEKKIDYHTENNLPSRIKYICSVDPTMAIEGQRIETSGLNGANKSYMYVEDSYQLSPTTNDNGETVLTFNNDIKKTYSWSIMNKIITQKKYSSDISATMTANHLTISTSEKKDVKDSSLFKVTITSNSRLNQQTTITDSVETNTDTLNLAKLGVPNIPVQIIIKNSKGTSVKKIEKSTNSDGKISINLWDVYDFKVGKYTITTKYNDKKISTNLIVCDKDCTYTQTESPSVNISINTSNTSKALSNVYTGTITGNDSFYTNNMTVDTENGEVFISKLTNNSTKKRTTWSTLSEAQLKKVQQFDKTFTISSTKHLDDEGWNVFQGNYGMLTFTVKNDCTVYKITPMIKSFVNIKDFKILIFENDKMFNKTQNRTTYIKELGTEKSENTNFPNFYASSWIKVQGQNNHGVVTPLQQHSFVLGNAGKKLKKGTYSLLIIPRLRDKNKDGYITMTQYSASDADKYGAVSTVRGTLNPSKVYILNYNLTNRTWLVQMEISEDYYNKTGTLISKTINTVNNVRSCRITANYEIPSGCDVDTYVSNNGGKTYVLMGNHKNKVTFTGLGHEFKWKLVFHGTDKETPKLKYSSNNDMKCAIKFELSEQQNYTPYEDYGHCFATPILNANYITRMLTQNQNVINAFEEWEFCRLWMEDKDLDSTIDICFAYDYDNYKTGTGTKQENWPTSIFFSQTLCDLTLKDFSQESIDYDNYTANVEYDENNFRLKYDTNMYNMDRTILTTPLSAIQTNKNYDYFYGDITNNNINMSDFEYGLINSSIIYSDNYDIDDDEETSDANHIHSGTYLVAGPYYQAYYKPTTTIESSDINEISSDSNWWAVDGNVNYDERACIIGISFENGLEIKDEYTGLALDVFPNLRDCVEQTNENGDVILELDNNGNAILDTNKTEDPTKYKDEDGHYYIPENTLEIVVALNPYGLIEDDNKTYGCAYPIKKPLKSCKHNIISFDLSDLYGHTIYSIGLRVNTQKENGQNIIQEEIDGQGQRKHPSLHAGDILGIGNLYFGGYNIKPFLPYIYTSDTSRWEWKPIKSTQGSTANILYQFKDTEHNIYTYGKMPITAATLKNETAPFEEAYLWRQKSTILEKYGIDVYGNHTQKILKNSNRIRIYNGNTKQFTSTDTANTIIFDLLNNELGNLFKINTQDINLNIYDWINIKFSMLNEKNANSSVNNESTYEFMKGELIFDLYDTTDITNADPIESLALPAWGRIQERYGTEKNEYVDKTVNAWFKIHTDAKYVKCIVLRRENPISRDVEELSLILHDITLYNTHSVPALGPQMHVRIYPKNMNTTINTKIRKFGGVYRIG